MTTKRSTGLAFFAGLAVCVLLHRKDETPEPAVQAAAAPPRREPAPPPAGHPRRRWRGRAASAFVFAVLFCAGGAISAVAGDVMVDDGTTLAAEETTTTEATAPESDATAPAAAEVETVVAAEPPAAEVPAVEAEPDPSDVAPVVKPLPAAPAPAPPAPVAVAHVRVATTHRTARVTKRSAPARVFPTTQPLPAFPTITFDPAAWVSAHRGSPLGESAVTIAKQYLGVPYVWGGNTPRGGFDCSGLTQFVYAQLGVWLPHYAAAQFLAHPRVEPADLRPGDLVFFEPKADGPGHVALYTGGDTVVEAPHTGAVVRVGSLTGLAVSLGFLGAVRPQGGVRTTFAHVAAAPKPADGRPEARPFVTPSPA